MAVFAAAVLINLPTLRYELLNWDDTSYVTDNPWIRSWSRENLTFIFTKPYVSNYLPLHLLSYLVDYSLWGLKPFGYHLQSVLLNGLNAVLGFVVARRLLGGLFPAFLTGLLFAVHPSHPEAVAWISSRKELLSTTFVLLSLYFYLRARERRGLQWAPYAASVACFTLGLLSKMAGVVLPLFLLVYDWMKSTRQDRASWVSHLANKIPYGLIGLGLAHVNNLAQVKARAAYAQQPLSYLMVKGHAVWNYLGLLSGIPPNNPDYDTPVLALHLLAVALNLAGLAVLPFAFWAAYRLRQRAVALGVAWVFTMLLPAILFPLVTYMAERYLYAPSLGFCWILAAGIVAAGARVRSASARAAIVAALALISLAGFTARTLQYNPIWKNSEALWTYAMTRSQDYRVYNNLAQVRINQQRWAEAERLLRMGMRVENVTSYQSMGVIYYSTQRYPQALEMIDRAIAIHSRKGIDSNEYAELQYNRGAIYWMMGDPRKAVDAWKVANQTNPRHARVREWLATARREYPGIR